MMVLVTAPADRSACLGKRQQSVPGSAWEMLRPSGEHRPGSGTAGAATDALAVALRGFLLDELSPGHVG